MIEHDYIKDCERLTRDNLKLRRALKLAVQAIPNQDLDPCKILSEEGCLKILNPTYAVDENTAICIACRIKYFLEKTIDIMPENSREGIEVADLIDRIKCGWLKPSYKNED